MVKLSGWYSTYDAGDNSRVDHGHGSTQSIPVPDAAQPPAGSDGHVLLWNPKTGVEYGLGQFRRDDTGLSATNGYRYHTSAGSHGRFADGNAGRGAGLPYLAGLVRRCELAQGLIDHALAFAYDSPSSAFVYPASKSDGAGLLGADVPAGSRLQLDPSLGEADFDAWGLSPAAKVIARALQTYGMYVVDNVGLLEDRTSGAPERRLGFLDRPRPRLADPSVGDSGRKGASGALNCTTVGVGQPHTCSSPRSASQAGHKGDPSLPGGRVSCLSLAILLYDRLRRVRRLDRRPSGACPRRVRDRRARAATKSGDRAAPADLRLGSDQFVFAVTDRARYRADPELSRSRGGVATATAYTRSA